MKFLAQIGRYFLLMGRVLSKPEKGKIYYKQVFVEIEKLGINSIGIVIIISIFMGAVITLQTPCALARRVLLSTRHSAESMTGQVIARARFLQHDR